MFFLISGYVISHVYSERVGDLRAYGVFLQRSVGRLVPLHLLTLAISVGLYTAFLVFRLPVHQTPSMSPACIADTALLLHGFLPCGNGIYFNGPSWSISTEMLMYAAFPVWVWLSRRRQPLATLLPAMIVGIALVVAIFSLGPMMTAEDWASRLSRILRAVVGFGGGVVLFKGRNALKRLHIPGAVMWLALIAMIVSAVSQAPAIVTMALCGLAVAAAVSLDNRLVVGAVTTALAPQAQLTYSLYMWHWTIVLLVPNILGDKLLHLRGLWAVALFLVSCVIVYVVARLSLPLIETPCRRFIDELPIFAPQRRRILAEDTVEVAPSMLNDTKS
jgi:peptidoglycan/LPS O-acetylase OafA/YrhL